MRNALLAAAVGIVVVGCASHRDDYDYGSPYDYGQPPPPVKPDLTPRFGPVVRRPAPPLSGGTLILAHGGDLAVAADPDRDAIHIVDFATNAVSHIALEAGDEPGRLVEDAGGR